MVLLRGGALAIGEVALRAGFASASHFAVVFHREVGVTQSEYRRRLAGGTRGLSVGL
jgi:AraC family transcriptional regulator